MGKEGIRIKNRKAKFEYEFLDEYEAGLKLTGSEIKSIRNSKASITEAYCYLNKGELFIKNMHIAEYQNAGYSGHEPTRVRKLLLHKQELEKIEKKLKDQGQGTTIIPYLLFINERGWAKLKIAVAKGKKMHDKRESIKEKDLDRQLKRKFGV